MVIADEKVLTPPARLMVIGVGGGGGNAVDRMFSDNRVNGVELVVVNTDAQVLEVVQAHHTLQIGRKLTSGLGGGKPGDRAPGC